MRHHVFLWTFLALAVVGLGAASAQAGELPPQLSIPPERLADEFLRGLATKVALTPQETAAVRPILIEQTKKRQDMARARLSATPGMAGMLALREDLRTLGQETDAKLAAVLPPEKMTAVRAYRDAQREQLRARAREARRGG